MSKPKSMSLKITDASHRHEYTLPVEWEYYYPGYPHDPTIRPAEQTPDMKKVSRLRCVCGEEISR